MSEHDVVGAGASIDGLVEVIAHRVLVCETLEVGSVTLLHVIESESSRPFTGGLCARNAVQIVVGEARKSIAIGGAEWRLGSAIRARPDGRSNVGKQCAITTRRIARGRIFQIAIQLLPHLIEAMDRARGISVVRERAAVCDLKWSGWRILNIGDACIGSFTLQTRAAAGEKLMVLGARQTSFRNLRAFQRRNRRRGSARVAARKISGRSLGTTDERRRQEIAGKCPCWRGQQEGICSGGKKQLRFAEVGTGDYRIQRCVTVRFHAMRQGGPQITP